MGMLFQANGTLGSLRKTSAHCLEEQMQPSQRRKSGSCGPNSEFTILDREWSSGVEVPPRQIGMTENLFLIVKTKTIFIGVVRVPVKRHRGSWYCAEFNKYL
jgi:hypothetical protein